MDLRKWLSGASGSPPSAPGSPSTGYPTGGTPGVTPPTNPGPYWFHQVGEELRAVLTAAGITPAQGTLTQLLAALRALFGTVLDTSGVPYGVKLGSIMVQWGTYASDVTPEGAGPTITFATAFPTACQAVFMTNLNAGSANDGDAWMEVISKSTANFATYLQWSGAVGSTQTVHGFMWLAIGY